MNCREFVDFLMDYVNGELSAEQQRVFRRHIVDCPPCIHFLDTYEETVRLEKDAYREVDCDDVPPQLVDAILAAQKKI